MKALRKFKWIKLRRNYLPDGRGLLGYWARLAARAAFRKGKALYCGHKNEVVPGMWSGGIVGLKSILGVKRRSQALRIMNELQELGYIDYSLDRKNKHLTYQIKDWIMQCCGAECDDGAVYATEGYGFICVPRNITDRLVKMNRVFSEADAWLDLWCHTTYKDLGNAFSFLCPVIQYGELLYQIIYHAYIGKKTHGFYDLIELVGLSKSRYYTLRKRAITLIGVKLWSVPDEKLELWLEVLSYFENDVEEKMK